MVRGQTWYVCDTTPSRDGAFCGCCHDTFCARFPPLNGLYTSRPSSSFRPSIDFDYYYRAAIPTALFQFLPYPRRRRYTLERPPLLPSICLQYLIEIPFPPVPSLSNLDYFRFDSVQCHPPCRYPMIVVTFYLHAPRNEFISTRRYSFQFSSLLSRTANLTECTYRKVYITITSRKNCGQHGQSTKRYIGREGCSL